MKTKHFLVLVLHLSGAGLVAQDAAEQPDEQNDKIHYKLIMPEEKTPEVVKANEPNPFNKGDGVLLKAEDSNSEENRVKDRLLSMRPSGIVRDPDGSVRRVMLGSIALERNMIVPDVLPDQNVHLRVNSLSDTSIDLFWIEKKKHVGLTPRPVIIPMSLDPQVRYLLPKPGSHDLAKEGKGDTSYGRASTPSLANQVDPSTLPTRRAEVVQDDTPKPGADQKNGEVVNAKKVESDPNHPANLLMNSVMSLLSNQKQPTQQAKDNNAPAEKTEQ